MPQSLQCLIIYKVPLAVLKPGLHTLTDLRGDQGVLKLDKGFFGCFPPFIYL